MKTPSLAKSAAALAVAGALLTPAACLAGTPFIVGGPGRVPAVAAAAPLQAYAAAPARSEGARLWPAPSFRPSQLCTLPESSIFYEPCPND